MPLRLPLRSTRQRKISVSDILKINRVDMEFYIKPEIMVANTEAQDVVCTSSGNENLFENTELW